MGAVWVARHISLEIDVAVKLMAPEYASSAEARQRFEREARASAQLRSPHVVHVYDFGSEGSSLFLVMELLEGEDLDARLQRVGRLGLASTSSVVESVCKALDRAHEAKLVHRDLKPANIFLSRQGREEVVKVLDFGIAKAMGPASSTTRTGTLIGSPHYMSPEQVRRSKTVDHRSDLWSLGVIVYQCLTGRLPFAGDELGDVLVAICTEAVIPPSQLVPDLGPEIDRFVARALAHDVSQRFQSALELAAAFSALVDVRGRPSSPFPPGGVETSPPCPPPGGDTHQIPSTSVVAPGPPITFGSTPPRMATAPTSLLPPAFAPGPPVAPNLGNAPPAVSTGSFGAPSAVVATLQPGVPTGSFPTGTLAPSGSTLATPPGPSRRAVVLAVGAGATVLLGLAALLLLLPRKPPPDGEAIAQGAPVVSADAGAASAVTVNPAAPPSSPAPAEPPSAPATAQATSAPVPARGTPPGPRTRPPNAVIQSTPTSAKAPKRTHDPLDHR